MRWIAPELLDPAQDSRATPSSQSDVYSFGSIMLQVRDPGVLFRHDSLSICWHHGKILTGKVPYHHLSCNAQVLLAVVSGTRPGRSDGEAVTDRSWKFIGWCWSPMDAPKPRPSSDEITEFTWMELTEFMAAAVYSHPMALATPKFQVATKSRRHTSGKKYNFSRGNS